MERSTPTPTKAGRRRLPHRQGSIPPLHLRRHSASASRAGGRGQGMRPTAAALPRPGRYQPCGALGQRRQPAVQQPVNATRAGGMRGRLAFEGKHVLATTLLMSVCGARALA